MTQSPIPTPQPTQTASPLPVPSPRPMTPPQIMPQAVPSFPPQAPQQAAPQAMPPAYPQQGGQPAGYPAPQPQPQHMAPRPPMPGQNPHMPQAPQPGFMPQGQMQPAPQGMPPQGMPPMGMPQMGMPPMMGDEEESAREGGEKALPQISIQAFCDRQETASVINDMTRDWRMKRVNTKIYMGGLPAATEFYHKENTPNLILVETGMRGAELFAQLESLASVCDEGTKVIIIGAANDIRLYRQLIDKGVSDYIVPPLLPLTLIRSIGDLYSDPEAPFVGRVAAFFGAKGGVGSSTLAHNIAWCLSEHMKQETALVDLDSSFGTTGLDFAYDNAQGLEEALSEPDRLDETLLDRIMIRHTEKLSILPAASSLNSKPILDEVAYEAVVNGVRSISPVTILDMPHFWSDWTTNILTGVDDVVITATPDLANLRNTKNLVDFLRAERPNDPDPILILNKTGMSKNAEIPMREFASAVGLEPNLVISFDPDSFFEAANEGKMLDQVKSAEGTVKGLQYLGERLRTGRFASEMDLQKGRKGRSKKAKKEGAVDAGAGGAKSSLFSFLKKGK